MSVDFLCLDMLVMPLLVDAFYSQFEYFLDFLGLLR